MNHFLLSKEIFRDDVRISPECSERLMKRSSYGRGLPSPSERANGLAFNCARPLPPPLTGSRCSTIFRQLTPTMRHPRLWWKWLSGGDLNDIRFPAFR